MFRWRKPSDAEIARFITDQADAQWNYTDVGSTREHNPPAGFIVDHTRVKIGEGQAVYEAACHALRQWRQFQLGWVSLHHSEFPPEPDRVVAVLAHTLSLWVLNAARIVYELEEDTPVKRYAYAYGTLPKHVERGEERFQIDWDPATNAVHYDILAFSQPRHILTKIGFLYTRRKQKQFARNSVQVMQQTVANAPTRT
ncbi:DUF1990 domain-containing protein [Thalassoroseus pseudoceratinae]|uniref:DUF1990 domain-containing protein n=1 Tax=Thalassoroseus pseudoceratinae TaxID=2713176 RepID=UPI00142249B1|nr:DUF1990 domain-containing protein [Thalassoroseus pseudoceratinae]